MKTFSMVLAFSLFILIGCQSTSSPKVTTKVDPKTGQKVKVMEIDFANYNTSRTYGAVKWIGEVEESPKSILFNEMYSRKETYVPHGEGTYYYHSGNYFKGQVHYGYPVVGKKYSADGKLLFEGSFAPESGRYDIGATVRQGVFFDRSATYGYGNWDKSYFAFESYPADLKNGIPVTKSIDNHNGGIHGGTLIQIQINHYKGQWNPAVSITYNWDYKDPKKFHKRKFYQRKNYKYRYRIYRTYRDLSFQEPISETHYIYDNQSGRKVESRTKSSIAHKSYYVFDEDLLKKFGIRHNDQRTDNIRMGIFVNRLLTTSQGKDLNYSHFYTTPIPHSPMSIGGEKVNQLVQFVPYIKTQNNKIVEVGLPRIADNPRYLNWDVRQQPFYWKGPINEEGLPHGWGEENVWITADAYTDNRVQYKLNPKETLPVFFENGKLVGASSMLMARGEIEADYFIFQSKLAANDLNNYNNTKARIAELRAKAERKSAEIRKNVWSGNSSLLRDRLNNNVLTQTINKSTSQAAYRARVAQQNRSSSENGEYELSKVTLTYEKVKDRNQLRRYQEQLRDQWQSQPLTLTNSQSSGLSTTSDAGIPVDTRTWGIVVCKSSGKYTVSDRFILTEPSRTSSQLITNAFEKTALDGYAKKVSSCSVRSGSGSDIDQIVKGLPRDRDYIPFVSQVTPDSFKKNPYKGGARDSN